MPLWAPRYLFGEVPVIGWYPFNETWDYDGRKQIDNILALVYRATKAIDPTRPCIDTSGNFHVITDIYDLHDYTHDPEDLHSHLKNLDQPGGLTHHAAFRTRQNYDRKAPRVQRYLLDRRPRRMGLWRGTQDGAGIPNPA